MNNTISGGGKHSNAGGTSTWKTMLYFLFIVIIAGIGLTLLIILGLTVKTRNSPCKTSATCLASQTCDSGTCVSLPGYPCNISTDCSTAYGPICQPNDHYCTNLPSQARGTSGNPPLTSGSVLCNEGLVLNTEVNLCQNTAIGSGCNINAQCGVGICDRSSRTCQFATSSCSTDAAMNAHQCAPGLECDPVHLVCAIPGSVPGGDGSPCNSSADCAKGNTCITGPAGSGWNGICRSGTLTWLVDATAAQSVGLGIETTPAAANCMGPLTGVGTSWCRYDIDSFMYCTTEADCQYPYSVCGGQNLCILSGTDPIRIIDFDYLAIGLNAGATTNVNGAFYAASYPTIPPSTDNYTGGKLIDRYNGFLSPPAQFTTVFGGPFMSFSLNTAFCVASLAFDVSSGAAPLPYYTAIYEDPTPILVAAEIMPTSQGSAQSGLFFTYYRQNYSLPVLHTMPNHLGVEVNFSNVGGMMWNPAAVTNFSNINVAFVSNPIVSPWMDIGQPQTTMTHALLIGDQRYTLGLALIRFGAGDQFIATKTFNNFTLPSTEIFSPGTKTSSSGFIVTSWDAISTRPFLGSTWNVIALFYGLNKTSGNYELLLLQLTLKVVGGNEFQRDPDSTDPIQLIQVQMPLELITSTQHPRLSRAHNQSQEPILIISFFSIIPDVSSNALRITMFNIASIDPQGKNFQLDLTTHFPCSGVWTPIDGIEDIEYVSSVTGGNNYGGFVIQCKTQYTEQTFVIVQVNAFCLNGNFYTGVVSSAIYWRKLKGETIPYTLYPIGGGSVPYFLATDKPLTFDGIPSF